MSAYSAAVTKREDMAAVLSKCPLLRDFSYTELSALLPVLQPEVRHVPKDEFVMRIGDSAEILSFILSGKLSEQRSDNGRAVHCLNRHDPGALLGLEVLFSGQCRSHVEYLADEDSELLFFDIRKLLTYDTCRDRLKDAALLILSNDSIKKTLQMDVLAASGLRERTMTFFRIMRDKFSSDIFQTNMTQSALAEYLGVNRSALSRELNNMQREGILKILPNRRYHIMVWDEMPPIGRHRGNIEANIE